MRTLVKLVLAVAAAALVAAGCNDLATVRDADESVTDGSAPVATGDNPVVERLQMELKDLGYYTAIVDGRFGPGTAGALRRLQREAGLPETGALDPDSAQRLAQAYEQSSLASVEALQQALAAACFDPGAIDGVFGEGTAGALRELQAQVDLPAEGHFDQATAAALVEFAASC